MIDHNICCCLKLHNLFFFLLKIKYLITKSNVYPISKNSHINLNIQSMINTSQYYIINRLYISIYNLQLPKRMFKFIDEPQNKKQCSFNVSIIFINTYTYIIS